MEINMLTLIPGTPSSIWPVIICAVFAMILGAIWYGPLFGRAWMKIIGADKYDEKRRKEMQKSAGPLYLIQFMLVFVQVWFIGMVVNVWGKLAELTFECNDAIGDAAQMCVFPDATSTPIIIGRTILLWFVFVIPTVAACSMWTADPGKVRWARLLIQSGYYLVLFAIFGLILGLWQ